MIVHVDKDRARLIVQTVNNAFLREYGLLADRGDLVESQIPPGVQSLSEDHARFLFFTVFNDHGMKSSRLYSQAKDIFIEHREYFYPSEILTISQKKGIGYIEETITRPLGVRFPSQAAKSWLQNADRLVRLYDGFAKRLFTTSNDSEKLLKEITAFSGYGPKTGGILLRAIVGLGFSELKGLDHVLVPVDIHDSRIAFLTGILSLPNPTSQGHIDYYKYSKQVQRMLLDACNEVEISWLDVDRALWLIGSRGCVNLKCRLCPLNNLCSTGRAITNQRAQAELF